MMMCTSMKVAPETSLRFLVSTSPRTCTQPFGNRHNGYRGRGNRPRARGLSPSSGAAVGRSPPSNAKPLGSPARRNPSLQGSREDSAARRIHGTLYRLPTIAFEKAFPLLMVEGHAAEEESMHLERFSGKVQEINRGLDYASASVHRNDNDGVKGEYSRLLVKARALVEGEDRTGAVELSPWRPSR